MAVSKYALGFVAVLIPLWGCVGQQPVEMSRFHTSLLGRTEGQRHNALKAAQYLHGAVIPPKGSFSFNQRVGSWTRDRGFVRAPVSLGGVLVPSWGGGVCQVATTLYNAALLAGLEILERHPHTVAPSYVPLGMDAAVAFGVADLRLHNPFPFPVRIECVVKDNQLVCRLLGFMTTKQWREYRQWRFILRREQLGDNRVRLWRWHWHNGKLFRREQCHETTYLLPMP